MNCFDPGDEPHGMDTPHTMIAMEEEPLSPLQVSIDPTKPTPVLIGLYFYY